MRDPGFSPQGVLMWNRDYPISVVLLHWWPLRHWSLWPRLRRVSSRTVTRPSCRQDDNPTWFTQLFCPSFPLAAGPPSVFTTDIVGCWGEALCRACNLTAFTHSFTGPVVHPFASRHEGPGFNPQGVLMWNPDSPVSIVLLHSAYFDRLNLMRLSISRSIIPWPPLKTGRSCH